MKFLASCNKAVKASRLHYKKLYPAMRLIDKNTQTVTLSVRNAPLIYVLKAIRTQTDYTFAYNEEDIQKMRRITLTVTEADVETVLDIIFEGQSFSYTILDNKIITIEKKRIKSFSIRRFLKMIKFGSF